MVTAPARVPKLWFEVRNVALQPPRYRHRPHWPAQDEILHRPVKKSAVRDIAPILFGGAMLVGAFAFAGHQIGRNAIAHNAIPEATIADALQPQDSLSSKSTLFQQDEDFDLLAIDTLRRETVLSEGKTDLDLMDLGEAPAPEVAEVAAPVVPRPVLKPARKIAALANDRVKIEPAAINLKDEPKTKSEGKLLVAAAKPDDVEKTFKLKKAEKQKVIAQRRVRLAEENCLARAVYFEARSESELGQMAVAKVILNRVKSPKYPNTICGVVYQGTHRRNSCQFSFACDGLPDDVKQPAAWANAKRIAQKAIAGDPTTAAKIGGALHYHADYVKPKWAKHMRKAIKIGTHIFYTGG
jgi:spore germination cell wall hydrolase CwlJ-like protein